MPPISRTAKNATLLVALTGLMGALATCSAITQALAAGFRLSPALGSPMIGHFYNPMSGLLWLVNLDVRCYALTAMHRAICQTGTLQLIAHVHTVGLFGLGISLIVMLVVYGAASRYTGNPGRSLPRLTAKQKANSIILELGIATGKLVRMGHGAGMQRGTKIRLIGDELAQNIAIFGGTGSGKTSCVINPILDQAMRQDCGIMVFDVKGDFHLTVTQLAATHQRSVRRIGLNATPMNLIEGLSPELAASYLQSALVLAGNSAGEGAIWNNSAVEYARNILGILSFFPEMYTLYGLYQYVFVENFRTTVAEQVKELIIKLQTSIEESDPLAAQHAAEQVALLSRYGDYHELIFTKFDKKIQSGIMFQLSAILSLFSLPIIEQAFCAPHTDLQFEGLLDGEIYLLDVPIQTYGLTAKTIYTIIKMRFMSVMNQRRSRPHWNQDRSIFFICDEYQEIVSCHKNALSDLNFWDKSRSSKCVGVISAQSVQSFNAAIGNATLAQAFLQNFRQQLSLATEDPATIQRFSSVFGTTDIERVHHSISRTGALSTQTRSESSSRQLQPVINAQVFRMLEKFEAIATLSLQGRAHDDIIRMQPLYVEQ